MSRSALVFLFSSSVFSSALLFSLVPCHPVLLVFCNLSFSRLLSSVPLSLQQLVLPFVCLIVRFSHSRSLPFTRSVVLEVPTSVSLALSICFSLVPQLPSIPVSLSSLSFARLPYRRRRTRALLPIFCLSPFRSPLAGCFCLFFIPVCLLFGNTWISLTHLLSEHFEQKFQRKFQSELNCGNFLSFDGSSQLNRGVRPGGAGSAATNCWSFY